MLPLSVTRGSAKEAFLLGELCQLCHEKQKAASLRLFN